MARRSADVPGADEPKRRGHPVLWTIVSVLLIVAGLTFAAPSLWPSMLDEPGQVRDMDNNLVIPDEPQATSSEILEQIQMVVDDGGDGFVVPSVDLDVPLGSINAVEGDINPPDFTGAFVVRNHGVSLDQADQGTVYIATHSLFGGRAPGNYLQTFGQTTLKPGDIIKANGRQYEFVEVRIVDKKKLAEDAELWTNDPGRLIVITCAVRPEGGRAVNNMVIIAKLIA
ncbi:MAG: class F sortase [Propionibacteriaceae bacterium]|nr:class F sortase [Propionibacteriaceae bacterium]